MIFKSEVFSRQTMTNLKTLLNQYKVPYGIKSVVDPSNPNLKIRYCVQTRELLIPDFDRQGNYLTCSGFAREAYRLFSNSRVRALFPEVKSMAYIWGSDEVFSGHYIVVLSPIYDSKLELVEHQNCEGSKFINWYLKQSVIFDLCRKEVKNYKDSKFIAKTFVYETRDMINNPDSIFKLAPEGFAIVGDHANYCWGFTLNPNTGYPRLMFQSKNDSFFICNYSDYQKYLSRYPWLSNYMIQNTLKLFWNMELVDNFDKYFSNETIYYR